LSDLVYQREQWQKRAQAAQDCADELGELADRLRIVVRRNYFGGGCVEGAEFYTRLRANLADGATSLTRLTEHSLNLVASSRAALVALAEADEQGERQIGGAK